MGLKIPAVISETGRNPLLQPLQIGGCGRSRTTAPATDRGGAEVQGLINHLSNALMADFGISRGIKALKINTGADVDPAATSRSFLEQSTIGRDLEPRDCWLSGL